MTHNNSFYHETMIPKTSTVAITIKHVAIKTTTATIDLFDLFELKPIARTRRGITGHQVRRN